MIGRQIYLVLACLGFLSASISELRPQELNETFEQFRRLYAQGHYEQAIPVAERILQLAERDFGLEHTNTATALANLAFVYYQVRDCAKAEPLYQRALKIREQTLGPERPDTAATLHNLAVLYAEMGDYAKAEPLYQRALKIWEHSLGPEHPDTATSLCDLGGFYTQIGNYAKAEPLFQRALKIREKALGPEHPDTATSLNDLGSLYTQIASYAKAEPLFQRALKIREKALGPEHPDTATSLNNLASLYTRMGDYAEAEPLHQRALEIWEKKFGPEHQRTSYSLINLGLFYCEMRDYAKAEPLFQRALKIREKTLGPEHLNTVTSVNNLAALYHQVGEYAKAEPLYQRALKIREKTLGPEHPDTVTSLNNLTALYHQMGDYAKAEPLYQHALKILEETLGPEHPATATSVNNLAAFYHQIGDYAKAEPLYQRALKIREKTLGPEHPDTATSLGHLGNLYTRMRNYAEAEAFCQRALKIREKTLGPERPDTASSLGNLGSLYARMGDYTKAEPLYQRALKIEKATLGPVHPDTAILYHDLAFLSIQLGNRSQALELTVQGHHARLKTLANVLSFGTEGQRLAYQAADVPYALPACLGSGLELASIVLQLKGVVLDSLVEDRRLAEANDNPEGQAALGRLRPARERLTQLLMGVPNDFSAQARERRENLRSKLEAEVEGLEGGLARQFAEFGQARRALSVTVEQVQASIPKGAVLVEFIGYPHYSGTNHWEQRYGAVVLSPVGEPKWVSLAKASAVDTNIVLCQRSVRQPTDAQRLAGALEALYQQIWVPIATLLPAETKTIILSPDGQLNFLSFATLLTPDDHFLVEKVSIRYVASGRDLLWTNRPSAAQQMLVFANPDFSRKLPPPSEGSSGGDLALRSVETRDLQSLRLVPLSGTAREATAVDQLGKQNQWEVKVFQGASATETSLRAATSPRVVHLATHGFFLPDDRRATTVAFDEGSKNEGLGFLNESSLSLGGGRDWRRPVFLKNPMHRSGLALAGAQETLEAWKRGEVPTPENDGIVTAEEVGALKLRGTWLVTLSACDTGAGEARSGEGVLGLRRGFVEAGAQNLLMTLWPVEDQFSARFMEEFYKRALASGDAPGALAEVQLEKLKELRNKASVWQAVRLAGPFVMSSQGPVKAGLH